jgi:DNA-binding NarL/FixJ family response regulator
MSIRVCIADDHLLILSGITEALKADGAIEVVGVTQRGDEVPALVAEQLPDVVLLDHRMPGMDGITCTRLIREHHPQIKVVMLSASEDAAHVAEALAAGASAYIGKRINPRDLASALRQIVDGVVHHSGPTADGEVSDNGDAHDPDPELTERELTMLAAISRGLSTKQISRELWITEKTVKFHLTNIYRKLGVHNRTGAMRYAFEHGLVAPPPPPSPLASGEANSA